MTWCRTEAVKSAQVCDHVSADAVVGQRVEHAAESARSGRRADQVLQNEVPPDEEGHKLPHRHVAVGVRRAGGLRHSHAKLSIAHASMINKIASSVSV